MNATGGQRRIATVAVAVVGWLLPVFAFAQAESRKDPTQEDCVTANDKAIAAKRQKKLRAAREQYSICASASCGVGVRRLCEQQLGYLNREIPTVVFKLTDAGKDIGPVRVTMDGELLTDHLQGLALSVDPGSHSFVFEARGMNPLTKQFDILQGQKDQQFPVEIPAEQIDTHAADAAFDEGRWSQALPLYMKLFQDTRDPSYLRRVAICRRHLVDSGAENPDTALETIKQYLDLGSISPSDKEWATHYRDDLLALKHNRSGQRSETAAATPAAGPTVASATPGTMTPGPTAILAHGPGPAAPSPSQHRTLAVAALATGGAFAVAGGITWKLANDRYSNVQAACDRGCSATERADGISAVQTRDRLTIGALVVGGALVATGVVLLLLPSGSEAPRVSLGADPTARAVIVQGVFR
jgi:hypothetical protein